MDLADMKRNGPFIAVIFAIAITGLALVLATMSLIMRM